MATRDTGTEQRIKDTAKRLYFGEGRIDATIMDIAEAADVSRTLVNYYFRSAETLIDQIYKEAMTDHGRRFKQAVELEVPFKEKINSLIDVFLNVAIEFPYQETFLFSQLNIHTTDPTVENEKTTRLFSEQIQAEMDKGNIQAMNPVHFMMNLFGLLSYPLIMKPMISKSMRLSDEQFKALIADRKEIIFNLLFPK